MRIIKPRGRAFLVSLAEVSSSFVSETEYRHNGVHHLNHLGIFIY